MEQRKKVLIFIVAYNAENTIESVLSRIPKSLCDNPGIELEILLIDDCSQDATFERGSFSTRSNANIPLRVLYNPTNLGYGGNQKVGFRYAIDNDFDCVALIHGDGQYAPEELPRLLAPLISDDADAVFGSRMMKGGAPLAGGMPLYKYLGNKVLTFAENKLNGTDLSEYHSGYRLYTCKTLADIPFERNSDDFDFDSEIIIQLSLAKKKIVELPIPTFYGDEVCHVNGVKYAFQILRSSLQARLQRYGIFYNPKFDLGEKQSATPAKFHFRSSHSMALESVQKDEHVLLICEDNNAIVEPFRLRCRNMITASVNESGEILISPGNKLKSLPKNTLASVLEYVTKNETFFDRIVFLDTLPLLKSADSILTSIRNSRAASQSTLVITAPNVAFAPLRAVLLFGFFNYGKRGILNEKHKRLFTFHSLRRLLIQSNFSLETIRGIPAPFPLAFKNQTIANLCVTLNSLAITIMQNLFSFQVYCESRAKPTTALLLRRAKDASKEKLEMLERKNKEIGAS